MALVIYYVLALFLNASISRILLFLFCILFLYEILCILFLN